MQRRNFIRNSAIAFGGLLIGEETLAGYKNAADEKVSVGVIGIGSRGVGLLSVLKELNNRFDVVAVCDVLDFRFKEAKEVHGSENMKEYRDYRKLLDDKK